MVPGHHDFHFNRIPFDAIHSGRTDLGQHDPVMGQRVGRSNGFLGSKLMSKGLVRWWEVVIKRQRIVVRCLWSFFRASWPGF
jgi:hypothetical protein